MTSDQQCRAFLFCCARDGKRVWFSGRLLGSTPVFHSEHLVAGVPVPAHETWFTAIRVGDYCEVEWKRSGVASPFPHRAKAQRLVHGEGFSVGNKAYLFYVERCSTWTGVPSIRGTEVAPRLAALRPHDLESATRRFLNLPHATEWAHTEFVKRTGFEQFRDGRVPRARACRAEMCEAGVQLNWDVHIWNMASVDWENGEHASFMRTIIGDDLITLWECATVLQGIPTVCA